MRYLAVASAFVLLLAAERAHACSCMAIDPATAFRQADAVLEGRVSQVEPVGQRALRVTLEVVQSWKGVDAEEVVVETASNSAACGVSFAVATSWLVYATRDGDVLRAGLCSRTARIEDAQDDLAALGAGVVPVDVGPDDEVEADAPDEPPARGGCASCSVSSRRLDGPALGASALVLVLAALRRRARRQDSSNG